MVSYGYDLTGRLTSVGDTSAAITAAVPPGVTPVTYTASTTYDALNRPQGATWDQVSAPAVPSGTPSVTFEHAYNKANQRTQMKVSDTAWIGEPAHVAATTAYTANSLNQYTAVGSVTPTYDGNGNLTSDGTYTLGYDSENRLTSASGAGNTATYAFDGRGRRKSKTVNGTTTISVTDADNREALEYDGSTGALLRWYAYALGPNDVLGQMTVGGNRLSLVPDIQGSIVAVMDAGTGTLSAFGYQPYGAATATPAAFAYTGQRIDPETGLYYYRARHYHTGWGRFPQVDPIGYGEGAVLYVYVLSDPLNLIDPNGLVADPAGSAEGGSSQLAFQGPPPSAIAGLAASAGEAITVAAGTSFGTLTAAAAAALAVLFYPSSTSAIDQPVQYVVRGGEAKAWSIEQGTAWTVNGYGFSVQTKPNIPVSELARGGAFRHAQISVTRIEQLTAIPGVTVATGTPGRGAYHGTVNVPYPPPPGIFEALSGVFTQQPNPYRAR